jgi:hypothetical protein
LPEKDAIIAERETPKPPGLAPPFLVDAALALAHPPGCGAPSTSWQTQ